MSDETTLLPCPFCGGKAAMEHVSQIWEPRERYWAACQSCHMSGKHYRTESEAIEAWNTRAVETCEMYRDDSGIWHCKSCEGGADVLTGSDGELDAWNDSWSPNYCPNCGRKVSE